jgi:hypothetical protein
MEILNHPVELTIAIVLSIFSTWWTIVGVRRKDIPLTLYGIAAGVPTVAMESWKAWVFAGLLGAFAWWLREKIEGI